MSPLMADCVAKVFFAFGRETLIQDRARTSNNDSKEPTLRFDCYKFLFHRACLATFATQSALSGYAVASVDVCFRGQSGRDMLVLSLSAYDPWRSSAGVRPSLVMEWGCRRRLTPA